MFARTLCNYSWKGFIKFECLETPTGIYVSLRSGYSVFSSQPSTQLALQKIPTFSPNFEIAERGLDVFFLGPRLASMSIHLKIPLWHHLIQIKKKSQPLMVMANLYHIPHPKPPKLWNKKYKAPPKMAKPKQMN